MFNEQELIIQLRQKNEPAFRQLVEAYKNKVFATAVNILQDAPEAEDVAQEVFIQVYESIDRFREDATLQTWIYRITVRKAIDKLRMKKNRQRLAQFFPWWMPSEKNNEQVIYHHPGVQAEQKEKAAALFSALKNLPPNQQTAFTLIKVQGMRYDEVAAIMQIGIKALESLISRAKINLQKQLEHHYRP